MLVIVWWVVNRGCLHIITVFFFVNQLFVHSYLNTVFCNMWFQHFSANKWVECINGSQLMANIVAMVYNVINLNSLTVFIVYSFNQSRFLFFSSKQIITTGFQQINLYSEENTAVEKHVVSHDSVCFILDDLSRLGWLLLRTDHLEPWLVLAWLLMCWIMVIHIVAAWYHN